MIRITEEHLKSIEGMSKQVELFKVINGYLIKGSCAAITDRVEENDQVEYKGYVDPGTELVNLYMSLTQLEKNFGTIMEQGGRLENQVISFIRVTKNAKGNYDSKQTRMSVESFKNLISKVQSLMNSNKLKTIEEIKEYRSKLDSVSEEAKALDTYIDFYSDHVFSFILHKYDLIMDDQRTTVKSWTFYDWNDVELRIKYELCTEFNILI